MRPQRKTQAIVVIHGIGEQKPMDTRRSFVETRLIKLYVAKPIINNRKED